MLPYSSILRDEAGRNEKHGPGIFGSAVSSSSCFQIFRPCDVLPEYILRISWISEFHTSKPRRSSARTSEHGFARNAEIVRTCIRDKIVKEIAQVCWGKREAGEEERMKEREGARDREGRGWVII